MIIKVEISEETWARMLTGKRVEGSIGLDMWTRKKDLTFSRVCSRSAELMQASRCTRLTADFNAHHRKERSRKRDRLIKKLPWGWVKESDERIKTFSSVPKELGFSKVLETLDEEHEAAQDALVENYIIECV